MTAPTQREIEDVILELLAEDGGVNPDDLRRELEELRPEPARRFPPGGRSPGTRRDAVWRSARG